MDPQLKTLSPDRASLVRTRKILLGVAVLWIALDIALMIIGSVSRVALIGNIGVDLIFCSYVGIPILFIVWLFMGISEGSKKVAAERLPGGEKFNLGEVIIVSILFLAGVIIPGFLGNSYMASHPGAISAPGYISILAFWTNLAAFLFAVALFRRQSKWTRVAAVTLVILSGLYFLVLLAGYMLSGFVG